MSSTQIAMQGLVKGTVQGVFFRASTQRHAQMLGLGGWVRNTADGHVEVCLTGAKERVGEMLLWLHKGPAQAHVTHVEMDPIDCPPMQDFQIRR